MLAHDALSDHITSATARPDCPVRHSTCTYICVCILDKVDADGDFVLVLSFDEGGAKALLQCQMKDEPHMAYLSGMQER